MDKEEDTADQPAEPLYPMPVKGALSDDHSDYGQPRQWAGGDPDKHMRAYFIAALIVIGLLFIWAVKTLSGADFFF